MPVLKAKPTLPDFQKYVNDLEHERGFIAQTTSDKCLLMGEELGELFKAVRKAEGLAIDPESTFSEIGDELIDLFIYVCAIANRKGIDLESAFRKKEEINKLRTWKSL